MAALQELEELDREQCLALLRQVPVGRLIFTERALPAVQTGGLPLVARRRGNPDCRSGGARRRIRQPRCGFRGR